jgi:hypothetical protein
MSYRIGETVIVKQDDVNRVGVVLDRFVVQKRIVYDVLLENRSAVCMIGTKSGASAYIDPYLSGLLCHSGLIETTIPYKHLMENDLLPITKS